LQHWRDLNVFFSEAHHEVLLSGVTSNALHASWHWL
jgi:hypothetical protein